MHSYDITYLGKKAEELGFIRDTLEKVTRLSDILEYFNTNPILKDNLALKGGTAINLTIFNLPRLSVDIDLDYLITNSREEMLKSREIINAIIDRYMVFQGYSKNVKTRNPHSLDSWIYDYIGASGNRDNIKIEINYSLRSHILDIEERSILNDLFINQYKVKTLSPIEIFGSKINALLNRAAARDLYDVRNMINFRLFDESDRVTLRKCVVFYAAISAKDINETFDTKVIDSITRNKIKTDLFPVIHRKDEFELESAKNQVKEYISQLMILTEEESEFLQRFKNKEYRPELLFQNEKIVERIKDHPMALWKVR
ncbi:MAG: nucleotidyl transferase AbiEii/AbiGii toxin family protein [Erysipelothrix sp.]|nr:nucleotidyl transferase AbiEii/AbiGii toxin family protein [Erysipelothrix sp.]